MFIIGRLFGLFKVDSCQCHVMSGVGVSPVQSGSNTIQGVDGSFECILSFVTDSYISHLLIS